MKYLNENNKITVLEENLSEIQVALEAQLSTFSSSLGYLKAELPWLLWQQGFVGPILGMHVATQQSVYSLLKHSSKGWQRCGATYFTHQVQTLEVNYPSFLCYIRLSASLHLAQF